MEIPRFCFPRQVDFIPWFPVGSCLRVEGCGRFGAGSTARDARGSLEFSLIHALQLLVLVPVFPPPAVMISPRFVFPLKRGSPGAPPATREENLLYMFINGNLSSRQLKAMAVALLDCARLPQMLLRLQPEDQARFVNRANQVRPGCWFFHTRNLTSPAKVLPAADAENLESVVSLAAVCGAVRHLPSAAVLSTGLEKCEDDPVLSTGVTDIFRGMHGHRPVLIEAFRDYSPQQLGELKEVRIPWI